jgi:hypothetical protein
MSALAHRWLSVGFIFLLVTNVCTASAGEPLDLLKQQGQTSGPRPTGLRTWIGKYPFDRLQGLAFFDHPDVQRLINATLGSNAASLINGMSTVGPIEEHDNWLIAHGCQPHMCMDGNWLVAINLANLETRACLASIDSPTVRFGASGKNYIDLRRVNPGCQLEPEQPVVVIDRVFGAPIASVSPIVSNSSAQYPNQSSRVGPDKDELLHNGIDAYLRRDYATAMRLFRPLAERGDANAQSHLGEMYQYGYGVQRNLVQAALWYRKAAEQGDAGAQESLGILYGIGEGVPQNYAEAMKWTLMAAKQGYWAAQASMSDFYKRGWGVPQNYILAYMWKSVAGHDTIFGETAKRELKEELEPHMAPSQIAEAQDLAQQCIESRYENCQATRQRVAALPSPKLSQPGPKSADDVLDSIFPGRLTQAKANAVGAATGDVKPQAASQVTVPLKVSGGGTFLVPVEINGRMTLDFILDSGASDVSLPSDVFATLKHRDGQRERRCWSTNLPLG